MAEIRWALQASHDLETIAAFIAKDSPQYARLFVLDILAAVERIAVFPKSGRVVPEVQSPAIREIILGSYRIVYRLHGDLVELLTIFHGARLLNPGELHGRSQKGGP